MERKPSEIIQDFLDMIEKSHLEYQEAKKNVDNYNDKTYNWTHDLEDAPNKAERNKIATAWQHELRKRRIEKDRMNLWQKVHEMASDVQNKAYLKRLRHLLEEQKKTEEYVATPYKQREYKRGGSGDGNHRR